MRLHADVEEVLAFVDLHLVSPEGGALGCGLVWADEQARGLAPRRPRNRDGDVGTVAERCLNALPEWLDVSGRERDWTDADAEELRQLETALAALSSDYRVPLLLFYFDGRSTRSIAETLGIRRAAVQTRLSRARKQLRRLLSDRGDGK